jgi:two-component system, OmpR family, alkaline phosphatase synthesis response regulator PhoP
LNKNLKILVVDDEEDIIDFLSYNLKKENYEVFSATDGDQAIAIAQKVIPDIIVLDLMMPGKDGIVTCGELKKIDALYHTSIIFLTARNEDYLQIAGFDAGAEDYITKPIKPNLFVARINAIARRHQQNEQQTMILTFKNLVIDKDKVQVTKDGKAIALTKKEYDILLLLVSKPGKLFERDIILSQVWGYDVIVGDRTVDVHVSKLREKIGEEFIKTQKGIGYRFED